MGNKIFVKLSFKRLQRESNSSVFTFSCKGIPFLSIVDFRIQIWKEGSKIMLIRLCRKHFEHFECVTDFTIWVVNWL